MTLMSPFERAYALAVARNPALTAIEWETIAAALLAKAASA